MTRTLLAILVVLSAMLMECSNDEGVTQPPESGSIFVTSTPTGAAIVLDNAGTGKVTPDTLRNIAAGVHTVKLTLQDYTDSTVTVTVRSNQMATVSVVLESVLTGRSGNWTGIYGSGRYGLSFVVDGDGNIRDFTLTGYVDTPCGEVLTEVASDSTYEVDSNGDFGFRLSSSGITETMRGSFTSDAAVSGTFDESFLLIGNGQMCFGSSPNIQWHAAKDCSVRPEEGASATRFCP